MAVGSVAVAPFNCGSVGCNFSHIPLHQELEALDVVDLELKQCVLELDRCRSPPLIA